MVTLHAGSRALKDYRKETFQLTDAYGNQQLSLSLLEAASRFFAAGCRFRRDGSAFMTEEEDPHG